MVSTAAALAPSAGTPENDNPAAGGPCANPLYPVVEGATWTYKFSNAALGEFTRSIIQVSADGFNDQDVFTLGVTRKGEWKCNNGALTALQPSGNPSASVQGEDISADFKTTSWDGVTLPAALKAGDTWTQNITLEGVETIAGMQVNTKNVIAISCTAGATESVTVQAGTFDAVRVDCQSDITITINVNGADVPVAVSTTSTNWYAPNVGLVKTSSTVEGTNDTMELTSYQIP